MIPTCPEMYEKLIQDLEADVRKHIRIQQQLKLHIESVEDRLEELESENDGLLAERETTQMKQQRQISDLEKNVHKLSEEKQSHLDQLKEAQATSTDLKKKIEELQAEITKLNKKTTTIRV